VITRLALAVLAVVTLATASAAQLEWDKHRTGKPVQNPTPVVATRADVISEIKELLARNAIPVASENADETRGAYVFVTQPVVFARGIVAKTQLGHFAEMGAPEVQNVVRGRVTMRIEISPSSPTTQLVGASCTFEGLQQGPGQSWVKTPSRGLLEDKFLKHLLMDLQGTTFDDVRPDESLLEVNGG
jgi:hypothetical protein